MARLRHFVPSAFTAAGIAFAAVSVQHSIDGQMRSAAWWACFCVLTDKFDGQVARFLKASSAFGGQLDSLADFMSFGVTPAALYYGFFSRAVDAGWTDGPHHALLVALVCFHLICVAARLARFNITSVAGAERFFFGVPTTYVGGMLVALFLTCLKYSEPGWSAGDPGWDRLFPLGGLRLDGLMRLLPWALLPFGIAMISTFRMPKLGRTRWRVLDALQSFAVALGITSGLTRMLPEYLVLGPGVYMVGSILFHLRSRVRQAEVRLPPLFDDVERRDRAAASSAAAGGEPS